MNNQQKRKKDVLKKRADENNILKSFGISINDRPMGIGVLLGRVDISQLSFFAISAINKFKELYTQIDMSIYVKTPTLPCMQPMFPIFDLLKINRHIDGIIATSFAGLIDAVNTCTKCILYYAFENDFIEYTNFTLKDDRIVCVARSHRYADILRSNFGLSPLDIVDNFELDKLLKIMIPRIRG